MHDQSTHLSFVADARAQAAPPISPSRGAPRLGVAECASMAEALANIYFKVRE